ncbi:MAG: hypothetical protein GY855_12895, partial [candidate division Zixibacteria bacterium]|nr:hypothetical protein [candidate division Zixibacteria bacterium]
NDANPASLIKELEPLLTCSDKWQSAHLKALKIREMLGEKGAYRKAALIVEDELKSC